MADDLLFRNRTIVVALSAAATCFATSSGAQTPKRASNTADSLIGRLVGDWEMRGQVRGQSVIYDATGRWTLDHRFVELHMRARGGRKFATYTARRASQ